MYQKAASLLVLCMLAFGLAACGSKDTGKSGDAAETQTASQEIVIKADNWKFDQAEYAVPKDTPVKITLENVNGAHGVKVDGTDINLGPGKQSTVVTLKEGTYDFHCSIYCGAGHAKMKAKLIVK